MPRNTLDSAAARLRARLDRLAGVSEERSATTRTFLSPAMRRANGLVGSWMRSAGLAVREDTVGNLIGRLGAGGGEAPALVMGSHLDTVWNGGRFDGALGVLLPIAALEVLRARGVRLPFPVEIVGFSEEEGVRFSSAYLGSKGYTGTLRRSDLARRDADGTSVAEALRKFNGRTFSLPRAAHRKGDLAGYLEVHIEQGPVLEAKGFAAGVVPAIAGQTRARAVFTGSAGHAGTTPMALRRDALAGAAEYILGVEAFARRRPPLVATVGRALARPGAANVIAGSAEMTLDVRHPSDPRRASAFRALRKLGEGIARRRSLGFHLEVLQDNGAVRCSPALTRIVEAGVLRIQGKCPSIPSGAGHDAVVVSSLAPVAMLFVRCRGGLSHHPDEFVHPRDLRTALRIVVDVLGRMAARTAHE
jgi:allantoate deiminase